MLLAFLFQKRMRGLTILLLMLLPVLADAQSDDIQEAVAKGAVADFNNDGLINIADVVGLVSDILKDMPTEEELNPLSILNIRKVGLMVVEIKTENNQEPKCTYALPPEGCIGRTVINTTKEPCQVIITFKKDTLYDSGKYVQDESGATIKISGNTSAYGAPRRNWPFKIKLQKKADLLFRDSKKYADKNWRLLRNVMIFKTIVNLRVSQLLGMTWTPECVPCNVFVNGDYRGCYLLIESVERNKDCRINVDKQTGFIVERDPYWWSVDRYFSTSQLAVDNKFRWTWKYPDDNDATSDQESYIRDYIEQAEQSFKDGTYEKYIDTESFARWILVHDVLGTQDGGGSNLFVTKYDNTDTTRLEMPVLWDFDYSYSEDPKVLAACHTSTHYYYPSLFNSQNSTFVSTYKRIWEEVRPFLATQIEDFIKSYLNSEEAEALNQSMILHASRWKQQPRIIQDEASQNIEWFQTHLSWLDTKISQIIP